MFKVRNSQRQPDFYAPLIQGNGGFKTDLISTPEIFECRPKELTKLNATGRTTIRGNLTYLPTRPAIYGKYRKENSGNLTQKPVAVVRNSFLPSRKAVNLPNNNINRTSEEDRKALRLEDIERNGSLVQVADKTLNKVFEKFDLFTISDKIIDLQRKGRMNKKEVRASALLKLVKEVKGALRSASIEEVRESLSKIKREKADLIPDLSDLGSDPDEVAQNPALILALMNEVFDEPDTNEFTMLLIAEMLRDGAININPETGMINNVLNIRVLSQLDLQDIEDGIDSIRDVDTRLILATLLNYADKKEKEVDEDTDLESLISSDEESDLETLISSDEDEKYPDVDLPKTMPFGGPEIPKDLFLKGLRKPPQPPRELGFLPQPINPPSIPDISVPSLPVDDEIYDVIEYGSNEKTKKKVQNYVMKMRDDIAKMLSRLPRQIDPSFEDKIKMNKKRMLDIGKDILSVEGFESQEMKDYVQNLINQLNEEKQRLTNLVYSIEPPKPPVVEQMLDDEPLIEEIQEEVKEENNPFADEETLTQVLNNENRVAQLKKLAGKFNKYVASLPKFKVNTKQINNVSRATRDNLKQLILSKYRQFTASQSQPRRRMLAFDKDLEEKLRQCALQNTRNVPQKVIINKYKIPQLNDRNIVGVVADICKKAGLGDESTQRTFNCASRALITRLLNDGIINSSKAKELRKRLIRIQKKGTTKDKIDNYKRVFQELASKGDIEKGGPSVRPQPRAEPQPGEPSRPMTISDLPEAKTIEQIQRMR